MKLGFIDIEASGFGDGFFPLEIGWTKDGIEFFEYYIKPHMDWDLNKWNPVAEELHGISLEYIQENGMESDVVCNIMNEHLSEYTLLSDSHISDIEWLNYMYSTNSIKREFNILSIDVFLDRLGLDENKIHECFSEARKSSPPANSVLTDLKFMYSAVQLGMKSVS